MNSFFSPSRPSPKPWPNRKKQTNKSAICLCSISLLAILFLSVFFITYSEIPKSIFSISSFSGSVEFPQCRSEILSRTLLGQRFLLYAPHSGFSNQLSEFKNAVLMAAILNRTLVVPPVLDHHAVALGSCPKFRVLSPSEVRVSVWNHSVELLRSGRYVSMADVVDISSLVSSSAVRVIDFRYFASLLCGVDLETLCSDCRTTVWTYRNGGSDGRLDSFQADEKLKKKKKITYVRRRQDVYKALGHGSEAESVAILAFGSLFTAPYKGSELYIDIHKSSSGPEVKSLIEKVEFLPFVREIMSAGKRFATGSIKAPFLCAQLRLLDGQFKNHQESTFTGLNQKLESLSLKNPGPVHVFVMTDLPESNWTGTYLGDLSRNSTKFKLHFLREEDEVVVRTQKELASAGHGQKFGSIPMSLDSIKKMQKHCSPQKVSNVQLYVEEAVCSCASLGFVGTAGSTIADSVEMMRKFNACSS
ncbi:hypothetical protein N665_0697s0022 [Sinapis alba]|nr:hypothetical protein N665_0697s0022 [Sinapis alba]